MIKDKVRRRNLRIAVMQPGYLPWLGFFELMSNCDLFVFLDDVQYTKKDWRNRNRIKTANGWIWLSVPVFTKSRRFQLISQVQIDNSIEWKKQHLRSIETNYSKAKYFNNYFPALRSIYNRDWDKLSDINIALISWVSQELRICRKCVSSSVLEVKGKKEEKIINICQHLGADELYDSKAAQEILNLERFNEAGIAVKFQNFHHPSYRQMYPPFIPYMSAIDLLFNEGPQSRRILLTSKQPLSEPYCMF